ncbi:MULTISPECIES: chromate transporter [Paenibacillus]|uniref:Chromate transporter n=1 Tax=Paenibacillus albilobatus TaxID=2716884 RepID=A0A919XPN7_9BACL|nr:MULTISPECIES: chromate transporter [Paenibacillus]MDR9857932.1 chromate transporter [Paenibacillus sp. VCA1]GIO33963.1 chromate transporter [Paenibacillus albilobatus]
MKASRESQLRLSGKLFASFLKIGPTTFGGGYAILPAIDKEVTERRGWLGSKEMSEITALSGAAPGGIGVNVAALVGYRVAGIPGLLAAVAGITLPTIVIMLILCGAAAGFSQNRYVQAALHGIKPTVVALIVYAAVRMRKQALNHSLAWAVAATCLVLLLFFPISPLLALGIGIVIGLAAKAAAPFSQSSKAKPEKGERRSL